MGTTSNLLNHLDRQHPSASAKDEKVQPSMSMFINSPKKPKTKIESERITESIANMIVTDYVPLSIVEGDGFRQLMGNVAPDYTIPCRKTVRSRILRRYDVEKGALQERLKEVESAALTTDTWTSTSTDSFITVTEHHVTKDWDMASNVLVTRVMSERHTGENLAARLKECVSEFNLEGKVETCVHDNARNMESAGRMCDQWGDLGCFGHTLQLCLKPVFELLVVAKVVSKCRKLVGHFKHSTTMTAKMRERQSSMEVPQHALVQDVATRWNSTYAMMNRLLEQRPLLTDILLDHSLTKKNDSSLNLKDSDWDLVSELCSVLGVFEDVTSYMSTEKNVSASEIYPIVCGLVNKRLFVSDEDSSIVAKVKRTIHDELKARYHPDSTEAAESTAALASLLDPRYKRLSFFTPQQRRITESLLESRLDDLPLKQPGTRQDDEDQRPLKRRKLDFITYESTEQSADEEIRCYLAENACPETEPLAWWKKNELRFPQVATVARKVLAIPATSVLSERIFSAAGLLLNKLRNRLTCELVDSIIFLNKNKVSANVKLE